MMHQDYCIFDLAYCDDCGRTEAEVPLTTLRTEGLGGACICADCALAVAREMEHPALVEHERTERYLRAVSGRWVALTQALADRPPPATLAEMPAAVRALEAFLADMQRDAPFPWTRDELVFAEIRRALPYDVEIEALREPFDDVLRITLDRGGGRAIRWQDLARVRRALRGSDYVPMELRVVVRDAAQLRGMRDRALAPLLDPPPRLTREALRARFQRLYAAPQVPLP